MVGCQNPTCWNGATICSCSRSTLSLIDNKCDLHLQEHPIVDKLLHLDNLQSFGHGLNALYHICFTRSNNEVVEVTRRRKKACRHPTRRLDTPEGRYSPQVLSRTEQCSHPGMHVLGTIWNVEYKNFRSSCSHSIVNNKSFVISVLHDTSRQMKNPSVKRSEFFP